MVIPPSVPEPGAAAPPLPQGTVTRLEIEAREGSLLAPYAKHAAAGRGRTHDEAEHPYRTSYMRDRDRVVHAGAFRKLEYKTQVFVNHEGDYYRTRLTHTMEVSQIARTAARALRLNEDLTETIALSHDLGHGPFGHKGEYVLRDLMAEHGGFEHNEHGLRVVDLLEVRYPRWRGLNLTYEVREAFARHSPRDASAMGFPSGLHPLLEAQLVDLCDSLAYLAHDCDDGIQAGIVTPLDLCEADLWRMHWQQIVKSEPALSPRLRGLMTVKAMIDAAVGDLVVATHERIAAAGVATSDDVQRHPNLLVGFSKEMNRLQRHLSHFLHERFYCHPRLMKMGNKARRILTEIFEAYRKEPRMLDHDMRAWAEEVGLERALCDAIAAMSDREAQEEYERLFAPFERI